MPKRANAARSSGRPSCPLRRIWSKYRSPTRLTVHSIPPQTSSPAGLWEGWQSGLMAPGAHRFELRTAADGSPLMVRPRLPPGVLRQTSTDHNRREIRYFPAKQYAWPSWDKHKRPVRPAPGAQALLQTHRWPARRRERGRWICLFGNGFSTVGLRLARTPPHDQSQPAAAENRIASIITGGSDHSGNRGWAPSSEGIARSLRIRD